MSDHPAGAYSGLLISRRIRRHVSQLGLISAAAILLFFAGYRLTQLWLTPEITIAIPESEGEYRRLFETLAKVSDTQMIRIHARTFPNEQAVQAAMEQRTADFGVIRPDVSLPANSLTAAILREDAIAVFSWASAKIEQMDQLAARRIGLIGFGNADRTALENFLRVNEVRDVTLIDLPAKHDGMKAVISANRLDAIAAVGQPNSFRQLVRDLREQKPVLLPVPAKEPLFDAPGLDVMTIPAKSLASNVPEEETQVLAVSYRLVARRDVERATVSTLLQSLFSHRVALGRETKTAWLMKGPSDDNATFAPLPNHRGALDYYNREQQTFMDLYGDFLWLGLFAAGGVSSAGAWIVQMLSRRRKQLVESILDRLLEILSEARQAETVEQLDALTLEVDGLVTHAVRQARWRASDPISTSALTLAIDSSRTAIADRRAALVRAAAEPQKRAPTVRAAQR